MNATTHNHYIDVHDLPPLCNFPQYMGSWALFVTFKDLSSFWVIPDDERNDASVTSFISTLSFGDLEPVVSAFAAEKHKRTA